MVMIVIKDKCFNCGIITQNGKHFKAGFLCEECKEKVKKAFEITAEAIGGFADIR